METVRVLLAGRVVPGKTVTAAHPVVSTALVKKDSVFAMMVGMMMRVRLQQIVIH